MKHFLLSLGLSLGLVTAAYSQDSLKPGDVLSAGVMAPGAIICDTEAEIRETFSHYLEENYVAPAGCGILAAPVRAVAYMVDTFEAKGYRFTVARIVDLRGTVQFTIWGEPESLGDPA